MDNHFPLNEHAHAATQRLLPWYVNGTLGDAEQRIVTAHLEQCAECRDDLAVEHQIAPAMTSLAVDPDRGWKRMRDRIAARADVGPHVAWYRRRIPLGWAVGIQAVAATVLIAVLLPAARPAAEYRALGASVAAPKGNVILMFAEGARERDMRQAIAGAGARLVGGPTASGAWLLEVGASRRAAALDTLRSNPAVMVAEPIDPDTGP